MEDVSMGRFNHLIIFPGPKVKGVHVAIRYHLSGLAFGDKFLSFTTSQALLAFANTRLSTSLSHANSLGLEFVPVTYVEENKNGHFIFWQMKKDNSHIKELPFSKNV
ncbi:hypothetical protein [Brevibacillus laterosporus]|nr:hypothetical protein [Brevibacillus laterosporus]MED1664093.1 hypothetical protein [Brevibacillus laterosporus]MED1669421.1 hypothetical protein [Brevibacillus laterosporus]MED1716876.1 hypothetical protein [Brevibacillus laterosporus]